MHLKSYKNGFTLVEVLISVFIIGIISTVAVIGFQSARQDDNLRLVTVRLADALRNAQNYAQSGLLTLSDESGVYKTFAAASGYGVFLEKGPPSKAFFFVDNTNFNPNPPEEDNIWSASNDSKLNDISLDIDKQGSIEISSISIDGVSVNDIDIVFKRPISAVYIDGSQTATKVVITLHNKLNNHEKTITIDRITGRIDAEY